MRHVALFYDDDRDVAQRLVATIQRDVGCGNGVLVCVNPPLVSAIADRVAGERVRFLDADVRYARPVIAMDALWRAIRAARAEGAVALSSIGQIDFTGDAADEQWHWYEDAVNDVLADQPLDATCLFDTRAVPSDALAFALSTHHDAVNAPAVALQHHVHCSRPVEVPTRPADIVLTLTDAPGAARHALHRFGDLAAGVVERAGLVLSELVTNALRHGGGRAAVRIWVDGGSVVVAVDDRGAGINDPYVTIRPPHLPERGAGLWVSNLEATRLHLAARPGGGTRATALIS